MPQEDKVLARKKRLLERIEAGPVAYSALRDELKIPEGSLTRLLNEFVGLGIVTRTEDGKYISSKAINVFSSKLDYDLALRHSQRLAYWNPMARKEVPEMRRHLSAVIISNDDSRYHDLWSHLKSGYNEIWRQLESYRELNKRYGYPKQDDSSPRLLDIEEAAGRNRIPKSAIEESRRLKEALLMRLGEILDMLDLDKIPFAGYCQRCPKLHVKTRSD